MLSERDLSARLAEVEKTNTAVGARWLSIIERAERLLTTLVDDPDLLSDMHHPERMRLTTCGRAR